MNLETRNRIKIVGAGEEEGEGEGEGQGGEAGEHYRSVVTLIRNPSLTSARLNI